MNLQCSLDIISSYDCVTIDKESITSLKFSQSELIMIHQGVHFVYVST